MRNALTRAHRVVSVCVVLAAVSPTLAAGFAGLGILPGEAASQPTALSADGQTVVGYAQTTGQYNALLSSHAWKWTAATGMVPLGQATAGQPMSTALGISADAATVVGRNFNQTTGTGFCLRGAATTNLSDPFSNAGASATGISPDGSVILGNGWHTGQFPGFTIQQGQACIWTKQAGQWTAPTYLPDIDDDNDSILNASSPGGTFIVGRGTTDGNNEAMLWTKVADDLYTVEGLGDAANGGLNSAAYGLTPDGSVIVGIGTRCCGTSGLYWQKDPDSGMYVMTTLGDMNDKAHGSGLYGVSSDGKWAVGYAMADISQPVAMLWDNYRQKFNVLQDVLTSSGLAAELQGWTLQYATGITPDGKTIIGYGLNPAGQTEAWIATVPEPASLALLALAAASLLRRRKAD